MRWRTDVGSVALPAARTDDASINGGVRGMRVAIVHYWLVSMRGGEKVIEALCDMYPDADIFTLVYDESRVSKKSGDTR